MQARQQAARCPVDLIELMSISEATNVWSMLAPAIFFGAIFFILQLVWNVTIFREVWGSKETSEPTFVIARSDDDPTYGTTFAHRGTLRTGAGRIVVTLRNLFFPWVRYTILDVPIVEASASVSGDRITIRAIDGSRLTVEPQRFSVLGVRRMQNWQAKEVFETLSRMLKTTEG